MALQTARSSGLGWLKSSERGSSHSATPLGHKVESHSPEQAPASPTGCTPKISHPEKVSLVNKEE